MANPNFPTNPGYNIYVGARYVPIFSGEWDATKRYENLEIVNYKGEQYTSKSYVPVGTPPTDETYWAKSSDFNPEFDALEKRVENHEGRITQNEEAIRELQEGAGTGPDLDQLKQDVADLQQSQAVQDTDIENLETLQGQQATQISAHGSQITALETTQAAQDTKIAALENTQTVQDGKISSLETSQTAQDTKISALEVSQAAQDDEISALKEENTAQQDAIDALKAASGDLPGELEQIIGKNREQDTRLDALDTVTRAHTTQLTNTLGEVDKLKAKDKEIQTSLDSLNEAQTEVQNQLSALEDGSVELPYVKNVNGSVKGHISYTNNPETGDPVVGGRVEGTSDSLMLHGGGPTLPTHVTIGANQVSFDKPVSVNGVVSHSDATADTQSATLGQVKALTGGASGSAAEALTKANEAAAAAQAAQNAANTANAAAGAAQTTANQAVAAANGKLAINGSNEMVGTINTARYESTRNAIKFNGPAGDTSRHSLALFKNPGKSEMYIQVPVSDTDDAGEHVILKGVAAPIGSADAANKAYVDGRDNLLLPLNGARNMTGALHLASTDQNQLVFKQMGDVNFSRLFFWRNPNNKDIVFGSTPRSEDGGPQITLTGLGTPLYPSDAATKQYVDEKVAGGGGSSLQLKFLNLRADLYNNDVASGYITLAGYGIVNSLGRGIYNLVGSRTNQIPISANERIMVNITNMPENGAICSAFMGNYTNVNVQFACTRFSSNVVSFTSLTAATGVQLRVGVSIMVS